MDSAGGKPEDGKYKHTVDLPKTTFGMRANAVVREPEIQKLWEENQVWKRVVNSNTGVRLICLLIRNICLFRNKKVVHNS